MYSHLISEFLFFQECSPNRENSLSKVRMGVLCSFYKKQSFLCLHCLQKHNFGTSSSSSIFHDTFLKNSIFHIHEGCQQLLISIPINYFSSPVQYPPSPTENSNLSCSFVSANLFNPLPHNVAF